MEYTLTEKEMHLMLYHLGGDPPYILYGDYDELFEHSLHAELDKFYRKYQTEQNWVTVNSPGEFELAPSLKELLLNVFMAETDIYIEDIHGEPLCSFHDRGSSGTYVAKAGERYKLTPVGSQEQFRDILFKQLNIRFTGSESANEGRPQLRLTGKQYAQLQAWQSKNKLHKIGSLCANHRFDEKDVLSMMTGVADGRFVPIMTSRYWRERRIHTSINTYIQEGTYGELLVLQTVRHGLIVESASFMRIAAAELPRLVRSVPQPPAGMGVSKPSRWAKPIRRIMLAGLALLILHLTARGIGLYQQAGLRLGIGHEEKILQELHKKYDDQFVVLGTSGRSFVKSPRYIVAPADRQDFKFYAFVFATDKSGEPVAFDDTYPMSHFLTRAQELYHKHFALKIDGELAAQELDNGFLSTWDLNRPMNGALVIPGVSPDNFQATAERLENMFDELRLDEPFASCIACYRVEVPVAFEGAGNLYGFMSVYMWDVLEWDGRKKEESNLAERLEKQYNEMLRYK